MEARVHSIWSELEETIKHQVEDILSCVNQTTHGLCKELTERIDETQSGEVPTLSKGSMVPLGILYHLRGEPPTSSS
jgi:hypothetical protein